MNATLGGAANVLGLASAVMGVVTVGYGLVRHRPELVRVGRRYAWLTFACALAAFVVMERALITRDFTVAFVAEHGSSRTPALFNFATLWSALEGSDRKSVV